MLALGGGKIYELVCFYRKNSNDLRGSPSLVTPQEDRPLPGGTGNPNQSQEGHGCVSPAQEDLKARIQPRKPEDARVPPRKPQTATRAQNPIHEAPGAQNTTHEAPGAQSPEGYVTKQN